MTTRSTTIILFVIFLVLAGSFFLYQQSSAIYAGLNSLKLIPQPETFTELYFENASYLPRATVAGKPISFAFTIHNVEATTTVYPYEVYFEGLNGIKEVLQSGTVSLADNTTTTINVSYIFLASDLQGEVAVNLTSLNQSIDFLLPNTN